ncbi:rhomboid-related protein 2-like [Palaemon carinicauda]|uniref:rhomboid-related protein 2-like n=1 Tax=Palaemon carinicauda TaxID=392227 RepID=UPI0035B62671
MSIRSASSRGFKRRYSVVHLNDIAEEFWDNHDPQKAQRIPLGTVKEKILFSDEADGMSNALVIQLLQKADTNHDGHIEYDEFLHLKDSVEEYSLARHTFNKAALSVVPRSERTLKKRAYLQEYTCCPPPLFMISAMIIEVVVFTYYLVDMGLPMGVSGPAPTYSPLIYNPFRRYEAWRYISYALIHSGYMHIINNLIVQTILGVILEMVHGWWRVGFIYLSGVFFGALAHSITSPKTYLAGASGGVFAVEYAHLGNLLLNWSEMEYRWLQLVIILLFSGGDLSFAIYDTYFSPNPSNTGHMAHLGGAVAGILVGIYILRNLEQKRWEKYCWWVALVVFLILVGTGVVLNIALPVPEFFPYDDDSPILLAEERFRLRQV